MNQNDPTTPATLSPAAQAVLDAFLHAMCNNKFSPAAVLRAAADQVVPEPPHPGFAQNDYVEGAEDKQWVIRFSLLAIADELEGFN